MRWAKSVWVGLASLALGLAYGLIAPAQLTLIDQIGFRDAAARMRGGEAFYSAYLAAFGDGLGAPIDQARGVRAPTIFLVWRWIPDQHLHLAYLLLVVVLTAVLLSLAAPTRPFAALAPAVYLLVAGRSLGGPHVDAWMLCEIWAVPALAAGILAWTRGRDRLAVACVVVAVMVREIAAVALLVGLGLAILRRRPWRPWIVGVGSAATFFGTHLALASASLTGSGGGVAPLRGSAEFPRTVLEMMSWNAPAPTVVFALTAFGGALLCIRRRPELAIGAIALPIPLLGLLVGRDYWGILAVPFAWWLTAIVATDIVSPVRGRTVIDLDALTAGHPVDKMSRWDHVKLLKPSYVPTDSGDVRIEEAGS